MKQKQIVKIIKFISSILLLLAILALVGWVASTALDKNEVAECHELERQSKEFGELIINDENGNPKPLFYITKWQDEMCRAHGLNINARIER